MPGTRDIFSDSGLGASKQALHAWEGGRERKWELVSHPSQRYTAKELIEISESNDPTVRCNAHGALRDYSIPTVVQYGLRPPRLARPTPP